MIASGHRNLVKAPPRRPVRSGNRTWQTVQHQRSIDALSSLVIRKSTGFVDLSVRAASPLASENLSRRAWTGPFSLSGSDARRAFSREDPNYESIETQVRELREDASEQNEPFDEQSAQLLLRFCHDLAADSEPAVFRLANGNLRALWQNQIKDQIGIQFCADGQFQFVMLRDRRSRTLKTLGMEDADTIHQIASVLRLTSLWFNG